MGKVIESYYGERTGQIDTMYSKLEPPEGAEYIGKRGMIRKDGYEKASGVGIFTRDIILPGMLYAKQLQSPYAHAKIKSMDTSKAEALPGVRAIIRYDDPEAVIIETPGTTSTELKYSTTSPLTIENVFNNQPVAVAVAADSQEICDEAIRLIEIEWEELPQETDWEVAIKDEVILEPGKGDTNIIKDNTIEWGDVEDGFAKADHIIEFRILRKENCVIGVEPQLWISQWQGDYLHMWARRQYPDLTKFSNFKDLPRSKMFMNVPLQGGTFGGTIGSKWGSGTYPRLDVELARKTGKAVALVCDGEIHFFGHDHNTGTYMMKAGFKDDGTITALDGEFWCVRNGGDLFVDTKHQTGIKNIRTHAIDINDSRGPSICHRDGGDVQLVPNAIFGQVAAFLEMDPTEVALKNLGSEGKTWEELQEWRNEHFLEPNRNSLKECIDIAKAKIDWDNKWHTPGAKKLPNGRYHGLGISWGHVWAINKKPCFCAIAILSDGTVSILAEHTDIGVGASTAYCQIVADELGMKYDDVTQRSRESLGNYYFPPPHGSTNTVGNSPSIVRCSRKAKQMLLELACQPNYPNASKTPPMTLFPKEGQPAAFPDKTWQELDVKNSVIFEKANPGNKQTVAEVTGRYYSFAWGAGAEPVIVDDYTGCVDHRYPGCYQCHIVEVEVDPDTGQVFITKVVNVNDVGKAINPDNLNGQQYGGSYMGLGSSNMEEVCYDPQTGVKMNNDLEGYHIALMNDIGPIDCNLVETGQGYGAYGLCAIGESIGALTYNGTYNAIYNAIGKWPNVMPSTPDRVLKLLGKI